MKKRMKWIMAVLISVGLIVQEIKPILPVYAENNSGTGQSSVSTLTEKPSDENYDFLVAENDVYELMGRTDGKVAVLNKETGTLYETNPLTEDPIAKGVNLTNLSSQLYITYVTSDGAATTVNSTVASVNKDGLTWEAVDNGICYYYEFVDAGICVGLEYVLNEDGLTVSVPLDKISEDSDETGIYLTNISVLPYFYAASTEVEGYTLVPDGSGALIYHNNDKASYGSYSQYVYGRDTALVTESLTGAEEQTVRMPVFGIKNGDSGFLAVIAEGDTNASVNAMTSGQVSSYNNVYASFRYRAYTKTTFSQGNTYATNGTGGDTSVSLTISNVLPEGDSFSVKYILLEDEELDYVDMAEAYREYLLDTGGLYDSNVEEASFYLNLLGGITKEEYVLGIKTNVLEELTTYEEAQTILEELSESGIDSIVLKYEGWNDGGLDSSIPARITFESKLGGSDQYEALLAYTEENDVEVFLDFDFVNLYESGNGIFAFSDAAKTVGATPAYQYTYDLNLLTKNSSERWKLLTPTKVLSAVTRMLNNVDKIGEANIAVSTLGEYIYSDFSNGENGIDRMNTKSLWQQAFEQISDTGKSLMVENGNAYTFPYVSYIYSAATESSQYDIEDESVPFYQIVLHGYISCSTEPLNLSSDPERLVLKAVETGSSLSACLMYAENYALNDTKYNDLYSVHYETWVDFLGESYERTKDVLNAVSDSIITGHTEVADDVYRTEYENGIVVYVNYNETAVTVDGVTVDGMDFVYLQKN